MEKHQHINSNNNNKEGGLLRSITNSQDPITRSHATTSSEFVLQWGSRKRLRCMKVQVKDDLHHHQSPAAPRIRARVDRRVVRSTPSSNLIQSTTTGGANGHLNLRPRPASPAHRVLRNSESANSMKGGQSNGDKKVVVGNSPSRTTHNSNRNNCNNNNTTTGGGGGVSSEKGGGSSSGSEPMAVTWPPKFVLGLTNKEKEEDFLAIKGSKLPHRPKKRAKFIQRTVNKPRGLKAMGNMDSDSE